MRVTPQSLTISLFIDRPYEHVYGFLAVPANFPAWASGLADTMRPGPDGWIASTPSGQAVLRFTPPNPHGVLDHRVALPGGAEVVVPMRAVAQGEGCLVLFTLFRQREMTEDQWGQDADWVRRDLDALKRLLEA